jgi:hypothetical protein
MSKYGQLIKEARKQDNKKTRKPEGGQVGEDQPQGVNLSIKVSAARRRHWAAEAKRQGTTLTAVITSALSERFGEPT